jgi:hypothetical protein
MKVLIYDRDFQICQSNTWSNQWLTLQTKNSKKDLEIAKHADIEIFNYVIKKS